MSTIPQCVFPTALKLGCVTNFDMLSLVMGFISLVDEIQFMLISSCHICIRSLGNLRIYRHGAEKELHEECMLSGKPLDFLEL